MSLAAVTRFTVSQQTIDRTHDALRRAGREGFELFVLWSGVIQDEVFKVMTPHAPRQDSYRTRDGLFVRVEGEALHHLNAWLFEHGETLAVQLHAHPTDAYHSDTDDTYPIVTTVGGLSIVVPDFARRGVLTPETAAYRLSASATWDQVELDGLLEIDR